MTMLWKRLSLTKKIFIAIAVTSTIIVIVMALMVGIAMRAGFAQYLVQAEINRFDDLERALARAHDGDNPGWPDLASTPRAWREFVAENFRPARRSRAIARRNEFQPGAGRRPRARGDPLRLAARISLLNGDQELVAGSPRQGRNFVKRAIMPIDKSESSVPLGWIGLAAPIGAAGPADASFLWGQLRSLILASVLALILSALAALWLARQFLAPVTELARGASALTAGNYSARMKNDRDDELGTLIDHYNGLAESLEAAEKVERQWISDTSHELQTPLAVLRAQIEALQDGVRKPTAKVLSGLHDSVMRLSHLVEDINTLSRTREGGFSLAPEECDLGDIIDDAVERARLGIAGAGLALRTFCDKSLPIKCDRHRMGQLFDNLLENSRRYTSPPGEIVLTVKENGDLIEITIEDTAPTVPGEAIGRLFERFYRVEFSRSRDHGGSGLGLAICQAIAKAHGGIIQAMPSPLGGLKVMVTLKKHLDGLNKGGGNDTGN